MADDRTAGLAGDQGSAASLRARVIRGHVERVTAAVPGYEERVGVHARLDPDGTLTVTAFCHHDALDENGEPALIGSSVEVDPPDRLRAAIEAVRKDAMADIGLQAGQDWHLHEHVMADAGGPARAAKIRRAASGKGE